MKIDLVKHSFDNITNRPPLQGLKKTGLYRAKVVETNDPLNMNRLRVIIPELHDADLNPGLCPWACPAPSIGGRGAFYFVAATIGDWVWVGFEKNDPHVPVYTGFANPTKRGHYSLQQIHIQPEPVLRPDGTVDRARSRVNDFDPAYLPKDGRPMKTGWVDTYGNFDFSSAVGYFPIEHDIPPSPTDLGTQSATDIARGLSRPEINNPDLKYMLRMTKYGHINLMSDQGYYWYKDPNDSQNEFGEFTGDRDQDYAYEAKRWLAVQRLISEDDPTSQDRRRQLMITRYGHLFDMRDVGWGQVGPIKSMTRQGEYGPRALVSAEQRRDQRFIRMRTKGGMYQIFGDRGFHPEEDKYVKRRLFDDMKFQDQQLEKHWGGDKDARFMVWMTRYGWKFLLDDRGSDARNADKLDRPRGLGMLLKGRRRPGTGDSQSTRALGNNRGFFFQIMEKDDMNSLMMGSPMGHVMEMSDKYEYMILASTMGRKWSAKWKGFKEHEYNRRPVMARNPERNSHHLKIDHANEYIRFKTRGGRGPRPLGNSEVTPGVAKRELQQGFEARDTAQGDGPWVEIVDSQHRGLWMSKNQQLLILRGKKRKRNYIWIDDTSREIVIYAGERNGKVKVYTRGNLELKAEKNIIIDAGRILELKGRRIHMQAESGAKLTLARNIFCNAKISAEAFKGFFFGVMPGPGAGFPTPSGTVGVEGLEPTQRPDKIEPSDRGQTYNDPFTGIEASELNPKIDSSSEDDPGSLPL